MRAHVVASSRKHPTRPFLWPVFGVLAVGALLLAGNGVGWIARGLGFLEDERLHDAGQPMTIVLGALQIVGAVVVLIGLRALAYSTGLLRREVDETESIHDRALRNQREARDDARRGA